MKLILIGIQGAGKSTQGNRLSKELNVPYLSSGHIFREMTKEKTQLGRFLKETLNAGFLVPDDKTIAIIEEYLSHDEYNNGYILDGFPRTVHEAHVLESALNFYKRNHLIVLNLSADEAVVRERMIKRARKDDTETSIEARLAWYREETIPVLAYFRNRAQTTVIDCDGTKSIGEVHSEVLSLLELA